MNGIKKNRRKPKSRKVVKVRGRRSILKGVEYIDYKDIELLSNFINNQGKILPRRITGVSARQQRLVAQAIKRARIMALIPFVAERIRK